MNLVDRFEVFLLEKVYQQQNQQNGLIVWPPNLSGSTRTEISSKIVSIFEKKLRKRLTS